MLQSSDKMRRVEWYRVNDISEETTILISLASVKMETPKRYR